MFITAECTKTYFKERWKRRLDRREVSMAKKRNNIGQRQTTSSGKKTKKKKHRNGICSLVEKKKKIKRQLCLARDKPRVPQITERIIYIRFVLTLCVSQWHISAIPPGYLWACSRDQSTRTPSSSSSTLHISFLLLLAMNPLSLFQNLWLVCC